MLRLAALALMLSVAPAFAHHPLGGLPMQSFGDGLLSGVGHPILGFDHLFFIVAAGIAASLAGLPVRGVLTYVTAMTLGCIAGISGAVLPLQELLLALSLVALGGSLAVGRVQGVAALTGVFAVFGLIHGVAFAGAITGQEGVAPMPVLVGYLLALGATQAILALAAGAVVRQHQTLPRLVGAAVAGAGVLLCLELAEAPIVAALAG